MPGEGQAGEMGACFLPAGRIDRELPMPSQPPSELTTDFPQLLNVNSSHSVVAKSVNGHTEGKLRGGCRTLAVGQDSVPGWRLTRYRRVLAGLQRNLSASRE